MTSGAAAFVAVVAFAVPLALSSSANAQTTVPSSSSTTPPPSTSSTSPASTTSSTTASTTSTTQKPTSTTVSPPVTGAGIVVLGADGRYSILADGDFGVQADGEVLARTGTSSQPVWLAGIACLVSGSLALTFKRRRHLSLYTLRTSKRR